MSKSKPEYKDSTPDRELYSGLIRLHVLHHATEGPIFGLGMIEELARHGYRISPGTLYPLLHRMTHRGYLKSREVRLGRTRRRLYRATARGRRALATVFGQSSRSTARRWILTCVKRSNSRSA